MNKEEILERNRKDNKRVDERFGLMQLRASYVMVSAMMVVWAIIFIWDSLHGQDTGVGFAIVMSGIAAMCFCQYRQLNTKSSFAAGVLVSLCVIVQIIHHILATV